MRIIWRANHRRALHTLRRSSKWSWRYSAWHKTPSNLNPSFSGILRLLITGAASHLDSVHVQASERVFNECSTRAGGQAVSLKCLTKPIADLSYPVLAVKMVIAEFARECTFVPDAHLIPTARAIPQLIFRKHLWYSRRAGFYPSATWTTRGYGQNC